MKPQMILDFSQKENFHRYSFGEKMKIIPVPRSGNYGLSELDSLYEQPQFEAKVKAAYYEKRPLDGFMALIALPDNLQEKLEQLSVVTEDHSAYLSTLEIDAKSEREEWKEEEEFDMSEAIAKENRLESEDFLGYEIFEMEFAEPVSLAMQDSTLQAQILLSHKFPEAPPQRKGVFIEESFSEDLDTVVELVYVDETNAPILHQLKMPRKVDDIHDHWKDIPINTLDITTPGITQDSQFRGRRLKKLVFIIRKFANKVLSYLKKWKDKAIDVIVENLIQKFARPYTFLAYNGGSKRLEVVKSSKIKFDQKTLLLMHGFLSQFKYKKGKGAFKHLFSRGKTNWMHDFWKDQVEGQGKYQQIIAINRPTLFHGLEENYHRLIGNLQNFKDPLTVLATSKGGFFIRYLIQKQRLDELQNPVGIDRVALISSGYSNWAKDDGGLEILLSNLVKILSRNKLVNLAARLTLDIFSRLPGVRSHDPYENEYWKDVIYANNWNSGIPFLRITSEAKQGFLKKLASNYLGPDNDWLLNITAQRECVPGMDHKIVCTNGRHGLALQHKASRKKLYDFLIEDLV